MRRDVFQAIADPKRREILQLLASRTLTVTVIAEHFKVSRPAISKHLKILVECGLILIRQKGRERYCEAKLKNLDEVSDWLAEYRRLWEDRFDRLEHYLAELQKKEKSNGK